MNSYLIFPDSIQFDENMAAIFKDGHQKGISQTAPEVHQLGPVARKYLNV